MKQTSVAGVFAAGDLAAPMQSAPMALAAGQMAGLAAHRALMEDDRRRWLRLEEGGLVESTVNNEE
ncbi:hypothetical protein [Lysobacter sp. A378]